MILNKRKCALGTPNPAPTLKPPTSQMHESNSIIRKPRLSVNFLGFATLASLSLRRCFELSALVGHRSRDNLLHADRLRTAGRIIIA